MKRTFLVLIIVLTGAISAFAVETQSASAPNEMAVADTSRIVNLPDTAAVAATLSFEEREAIADVVREEMNSNRSFYNTDMPVRIVERLVAIVAIVMPFLAIIFIAVFLIIHSTKRQRIKYEVMEKAISANYKLPNDIFEEKKEKPADAMQSLKNGWLIFSIGISFMLFFLFAGSGEVASLCLLVVLIGVGRIAIALYTIRESKKSKESETNGTDAESDAK